MYESYYNKNISHNHGDDDDTDDDIMNDQA